MLEKIRSLSLEQKIGQLFVIGLPGVELDESARQFLTEIPAGGVCLFTRNIRVPFTTQEIMKPLLLF